jgi:hypothetical protein
VFGGTDESFAQQGVSLDPILPTTQAGSSQIFCEEPVVTVLCFCVYDEASSVSVSVNNPFMFVFGLKLQIPYSLAEEHETRCSSAAILIRPLTQMPTGG